jgi:hypothetical protein
MPHHWPLPPTHGPAPRPPRRAAHRRCTPLPPMSRHEWPLVQPSVVELLCPSTAAVYPSIRWAPYLSYPKISYLPRPHAPRCLPHRLSPPASRIRWHGLLAWICQPTLIGPGRCQQRMVAHVHSAISYFPFGLFDSIKMSSNLSKIIQIQINSINIWNHFYNFNSNRLQQQQQPSLLVPSKLG